MTGKLAAMKRLITFLLLLTCFVSFKTYSQTITITGTSPLCSGTTATYTSSTGSTNWSVVGGTIIGSSSGPSVTIQWYTNANNYVSASHSSTVNNCVTVNDPPYQQCGNVSVYVCEPDRNPQCQWENEYQCWWVYPTHEVCTPVTTNYSGIKYVTVNALPTQYSVGGGGSFCVGSTGPNVTLSGSQSGVNYQLKINGSNSGAAVGGTGGALTWTNQTIAGTYTVSATNGSTGCAQTMAGSTTVTSNPLPVVYTVAGGGTTCAGTGLNINLYGSQTGVNYQLKIGGTNSGGAVGGTGGTLTWASQLTAGVYTVVATNATTGCTQTMTGSPSITVNALPVPTFTGGVTTACSVSTGNVYTTETGMTNYVWAVSAGGTITAGGTTTSNTVTVTWNTVGTQTVSIRYTNASGCVAAAPIVRSVIVDVPPAPTFTTGSTTACVASTGHVYTTQSGMTNYIWAVSAGGIITAGGTTTSPTATVTWNTAGAQTVSVRYTNAASCVAATPTVRNVTVNPLPVPTFTTGPTSPCIGSIGNIYTTESGMTNYVWVVSAGGTLTAGGTTTSNTATISWNTAGAQTVNVRYTNANSCAASTPTVRNVTVVALPVPTFTTGATAPCIGSIGNVYTTEASMTNYVWAVSAGGTITSGGTTTSNTATITWNTSGAQTVSVRYTNASGCIAAAPTVRNVTVNTLPVPTFTAGATTACAASTGNVYTTEAGMTNYTWTVSAGGTITAGGNATSNTATITWNSAGAQTLTVKYTNALGCVAATPVVRNVTVNALPVPTFTAGPVSVCVSVAGNVYTTEAAMTNYVWAVTGGTITAGGTTTSNTATITWTTAGAQNVSVRYTNANTCTAAVPTVRAVTVNALPVPTFTTGPVNPYVGVAGNIYTTQAAMTNYIWSVSAGGTVTAGGNATSNTTTVTWTTSGAKTVSVRYTNASGCTIATSTVLNVLASDAGLVSDNIELAALKNIYDSLGGATWTNKSLWPLLGAWPASATAAQMDAWYGVVVTNGDITGLSLNNNNLTGQIPKTISRLSKLNTISFQGNLIASAIPGSIGSLPNLTTLYLHSNKLIGAIPSTLNNLTVLQNLYLSTNLLSGDLPNLGSLVNLRTLSIGTNGFNAGPIPSWIQNFTVLTYLEMASATRNGSIPSFIGNLTSLTQLSLNSNQLTGNIPASISNLTLLQYLYLNSNQLSGAIPAEIGNLSALKLLYLNNNQLSGSIPSTVGNLSNLLGLQLATNSLTGTIPSTIGSLTKTTSISLAANQLTGTIPSSIGNLINLTTLSLNQNQLSGSIPTEIGNLTKLTGLYLYTNKLSGSLPSTIGNLANLTQLYVYTNQLSGELPSTLNNLIKLQYFLAYANQFSGPLPALNNWTQIFQFYIHTNKFSGQIPDNYFATWTKLGTLSIGVNNFDGPFPSSVSACPLLGYLEGTNSRFSSLPSSLLTLPLTTTINFGNSELQSIPNFSTHVNKINLTLNLNSNRLDFSQLEPLIAAGIKTVTYAPQKTISDTPTQPLTIGSNFILTSRPKGALTSNLKWEKLQPNGVTWLDISSSNADPLTGNTYRIVNATTAAEGKYRWSCTSTKATGMTLMSDAIDTKTPERYTMDNWGFQYKYDGRKRMIAKKVPGAEWVYMVYDNRDRLVLTQDGEQRKVKKWSFTKYDALNRPIMTGIYTHSVDLDQLGMNALISTVNFSETFNATSYFYKYTNTVFPLLASTNTEVLTVTYYDNYNFISSDPAYAYISTELAGQYNYNGTGTSFPRVIGQVTGSIIRTLGDQFFISSVNYYDDKYRLVQTVSDNFFSGGVDRTTNVYDFVGKVTSSRSVMSPINTLTWQNLVGVRVESGKLVGTSSGWGQMGASSVQQIPANTDGWLETTVGEVNSYRMIGFSDSDINTNYTSIDYALYLNATNLNVYENGTLKFTVAGGEFSGDLLRIARTGSTIKYYRNGQLVYTSLTPTTAALMADVALNSLGSTIAQTKMSNSLAATSNSVARTFTYDHAGRLLKTSHSINGATPVLLAQNEYNELGQLVDKKLHSADNGTTFKQSVDYRYNIRGWLSSINNAQLAMDNSNDDTGDLFGMNFNYNNLVAGLTTAGDEQFNGNISSISYSANQGLGTLKERGYKFGYDAMNRLTGAAHKERTTDWNAATAYHEDNLSYDLNGNIQSLNRKGENGATMDVLTYTYGTGNTAGNQLQTVSDGGDITKGFVDGNIASTDYVYDANGNMTVDKNKGITAITYNHLNLPDKVTKGTGDYVKYIYDATGRKLSQQVYNSVNSLTKKTDYAGEYIYENDVLQFVNHEEGRITKGSAGKQIIPSPQLVPNGDAASSVGFEAYGAVVLSSETQSTENYLKVLSNQSTANPGFYTNYIKVKPGKTYQYRFKGYRTTSGAYLYVTAEVAGNLVWYTKLIPSGAGNEAWVTADFTVPANVTQIKVGALWSPVTVGDIIYANKIELYEIDPVNGAFIEVDVASALPTEYQYHLKDHLGNVRTTFTSKDEIEAPKATLETATETTERGQFLNYDNARKIYSHIFDRTNGTVPTVTPGYSQRLSGSATEKIGLARSLSVMPGDKLQLEVFAKYFDASNPTNISAFASWINTIALGTATGGTIIDGAGYATNTATNVPFGGLLNKTSETGTAPKAYLNWLVFDRNYNVDLSKSGYKRLTTVALENGTDTPFEWIKPDQDIIIAQAGYAYIWLSNENLTPVEVYFDDFKVTQTKSPVIQSDDYYPFGLSFNSYQRENSIIGIFGFNGGSELQNDLGLGWYQTLMRMYSPDLGRFWGIDQKADFYSSISPMLFAYNNPVMFNDPLGLDVPGCSECNGTLMAEITITASRLETPNFAWLNNLAYSANPIERAIGSKYQKDGAIATAHYWLDNRTIHYNRAVDKTQWAKDFDRVFGRASMGIGGMVILASASPFFIKAGMESMSGSTFRTLFLGDKLSATQMATNAAIETGNQLLSSSGSISDRLQKLDLGDIAAQSRLGFNTLGSIMFSSNINFTPFNPQTNSTLGFSSNYGSTQNQVDLVASSAAGLAQVGWINSISNPGQRILFTIGTDLLAKKIVNKQSND